MLDGARTFNDIVSYVVATENVLSAVSATVWKRTTTNWQRPSDVLLRSLCYLAGRIRLRLDRNHGRQQSCCRRSVWLDSSFTDNPSELIDHNGFSVNRISDHATRTVKRGLDLVR